MKDNTDLIFLYFIKKININYFYLSNLLLPLLSSQCATNLNPIKMIYLFILLALVFQIVLNDRVQQSGRISL
jgi:hypothetical protein